MSTVLQLIRPHDSPSQNSTTLKTDDATNHKRPDDQSFSLAGRQDLPFPPADHKGYSASRTAAYVKDQVESQVPNRHTSIQASIQGHNSRITAVLDGVDKVMKK